MRIGQGYDVHRLVEGRKLILGGVDIPYERGLLGHSDADVLVHAIMDALLGAAAMGDIGKLFPDTDPHYEGADSLALLAKVRGILARHGARIANVSASIVAEKPRLAPHIPQMKQNIARALGIEEGAVGIAAGTNEGLGYLGRGEGVTVIANAPNPAGQSILQRYFPGGVSPLGLLLGALVPTLIVAFAFLVL